MIQHPKVVVIGAGSLFFGRQSIWQMVHSPSLRNGTLALVDTDASRLGRMKTLAQMVIAHNHSPLKLETSTERLEVLKDADFVILSFADRSVHFRGLDCNISLKYGIRMCSGDTIGPGGIMRTLREFPVIMQVADDIRRLCPQAWVINYINPTAANGMGLQQYAPDLKSFALCDGLHMPHVKRFYARRAGLISSDTEWSPDVDRRFDLRIAGVNHFTWVLKAMVDGVDVMPAIAESIRLASARETTGGDEGAKAVFNESIGYALYKVFGVIPACVGHTKEYVRYWQGLGKTPDSIPPLSIWETEPRYQRHAEMWQQVDDFISGALPIASFDTTFGPDHATDVVEAMVDGLPKPFYINTLNNGAVTNMADDAFLELLCDVDMQGPKPRTAGAMPRGLLGMQMLALDEHYLAVAAAMSCDRALLTRAFCTSPLVNSLADCEALITELLAAERDGLPEGWFR